MREKKELKKCKARGSCGPQTQHIKAKMRSRLSCSDLLFLAVKHRKATSAREVKEAVRAEGEEGDDEMFLQRYASQNKARKDF